MYFKGSTVFMIDYVTFRPCLLLAMDVLGTWAHVFNEMKN